MERYNLEAGSSPPLLIYRSASHLWQAFNLQGGRMRIRITLLLALLWVTACVPERVPATEPGTVPLETAMTNPPIEMPSEQSSNNPYAPQQGDASLTRGEVFIQEKGLLVRESQPPQVSLAISGDLPTPCHQLRVQVHEPEKGNNIPIEVYSVFDPDMMCTQVLKPFTASVDLGTFPGGHYSVLVNGEPAGEFDS
jgi:hypothetical protein